MSSRSSIRRRMAPGFVSTCMSLMCRIVNPSKRAGRSGSLTGLRRTCTRSAFRQPRQYKPVSFSVFRITECTEYQFSAERVCLFPLPAPTAIPAPPDNLWLPHRFGWCRGAWSRSWPIYVFAIRSERQICREIQINLAYRWFCDLGLEDAIPDHSAFSRAGKERFRESDIFRPVFERVVEACINALSYDRLGGRPL